MRSISVSYVLILDIQFAKSWIPLAGKIGCVTTEKALTYHNANLLERLIHSEEFCSLKMYFTNIKYLYHQYHKYCQGFEYTCNGRPEVSVTFYDNLTGTGENEAILKITGKLITGIDFDNKITWHPFQLTKIDFDPSMDK